MSIVTRTGDDGTTALMYGRRVPKFHPRIEACGAIDELNAALGLARASAQDEFLTECLSPVQKELITLMGEVATATDDLDRYVKDGFERVAAAMTATLEKRIAELESGLGSFKGWATPGANSSAAALDLARCICRRAERRVAELQQAGEIQNPQVLIYLNRLADWLWLLARWVEAKRS